MGRLPTQQPVTVRPVLWRRPGSSLPDARGLDCSGEVVALVPVGILAGLDRADYEPAEWDGEAEVAGARGPLVVETWPEPEPESKPKSKRRSRKRG